MRSTIKLFKALPIETKGRSSSSKRALEKTIKLGFIFSSEVVHNYPCLDILTEMVTETIGIEGEKVNASFHKSWKKIKEADIEQLVIEQIVHYLTTYGGLGDTIYIPKEALEIPGLDINGLKLTVIRGYTKSELKEKLLKLLNSGIALREDTIEDVVNVALYVGINGEDIANIKNKEARVILYDYLSLVPNNPTEFLRFAIYQVTDKTLIIKSKELIKEIKENANFKLVKYFDAYDYNNGLEKLAEIFYRFKPLWLAFRTNPEMKRIINQIRRLAETYHKPMPEDYLNTVTAKIKKGIPSYIPVLEGELDKVNVFRKIRLAYALKFRTKDARSIMYRIRNGKSYATDFVFERKKHAKRVLDIVLKSIAKDIKKNVKGKKIYIPDCINYALPATEKQFTGNFPSGTYISVPHDMIVGIYWENINGRQIDLDLSSVSMGAGKIGWDTSYRNSDRSILFSGDITDAPMGATELFYVRQQINDNLIFFLNYYNYNEDIKVPYKIIVAQEQAKNFDKGYMVNPNNIISTTLTEISQKQKIIGLLSATEEGSKFYFCETSIGKSITSSDNAIANHSRQYLMDFYKDSIELKDILTMAGALLTDDDETGYDIDLSPENLEKDTILNLLI